MITRHGPARSALPFLLIALAACRPAGPDVDAGRPAAARSFPRADRPVAAIVSTQFSSEDVRDRLGEAQTVMDLARIEPDATVADLGAGEGYYTVRLAERVGPRGRVLAEDIDKAALERLGLRAERQRLDNVSIKQGTPEDPKLPAGSFDRIFMVHMYHEVAEPYAFLWNLQPALKPGGSVIVVDADRDPARHGMPPALLFCEFAAVGFRLAEFVRKPTLTGYYAKFEVVGPRPAPSAIRPCRLGADGTGKVH